MLALTFALVAPYFIDWTNYRSDFEREASAILGRKVTVEGSASARILPFPSVTFTDVTVGEGPVPVATVEEFSMDAELAPLMAGDFVIFDMRIVRPAVNLGVDANGRLDWALAPSSPFAPANIKLESVSVTEGQATIRDALSGREHRLTEVNADMSARALTGPWRIDGTFRFDGMRTAVGLSTGAVSDDGSLRLRARIDPLTYPFEVETDGGILVDGGKPRYAGSFKLNEKVEKTAELRGSDGATVRVSETKVPAYRMNGQFALTSGLLDLTEYRLETGPLDDPYVADGHARIDLGETPHFTIEADGAQVRFDEALDVAGEPSGFTLADRVKAIHEALLDLPKPSIPGTIKVDLPAVVAGDTTIREVKLSAQPAETGWQIDTFSATLPGRATLEGEGLLRTGETDFGFSGSMLLAVAQPSGFAAWLSKDVDDAIRRLPAAGFSGKVEMTQQRQSFRDVELMLGNAKFRGQLDNDSVDGRRPSLSIKLEGDALDLDGMSAFASIFVNDSGATRFADRDIDVAVKAGPVSVSRLTADSVDTALRLRGGTLEIDRLSIGGLAGVSISAAGTVRDVAGSPTGNLDASIVATDLAPLFSTLAAEFPDNGVLSGIDRRAGAYSGLFADTRFDVVLTAANNDDKTTGIALSAKGTSGGTSFTVSGSGSGLVSALDDANFKLDLSAENPDAGSILALYGVRALPLGVAGAASTSVKAEGSVAQGVTAFAEINGDDMQTEFDGLLVLQGGNPTARGDVRIEAADMEPWLITTGVALHGMGLGLPVSLSGKVDASRELVVVSDIEGEVADGPVSGDINAAFSGSLPEINGAFSVDFLDLGQVVALVIGDAAFEFRDTYVSDTPFAADARPPFIGDIDVTALTLAAAPFGDLENAHFDLRIDADAIKIAGLKGDMDGGTMGGLLELKNTSGNVLFSSQLKLSGADIGQVLDGSALSGKTDISATLSASGKSASGLIASLAGSGIAAIRDVSVRGINPDAFATIIVEADKIGRDIDAIKTAGFAPAIVSNGTFPATGAEIAFTVASGVLRAPPVALESGTTRLTGDLRFDANMADVAVNGSVAYGPGDEALVGSEPVVEYALAGPIDQPTLSLNTEPLAQFLTQRALEKEQARVEALQASLLEKQRLRREVRYYTSLQSEREELAAALRRAEEERRLAAQAEAERRAQEAAEKAAEEAREAEETARKAADEEAKAKAEAEAAVKAEQAKKAAEEAARQEAARRKAEEEAAARQSDPTGTVEPPAPEVESPPIPLQKPGVVGEPLPPPTRPEARSQQRKVFDPLSIGKLLDSLRPSN